MPRVKHRYPRNVARRKVAAPGTSNRLTRRQELVPSAPTSVTGGTFTLTFDRPFIVPSNAVVITKIEANPGSKPPLAFSVTSPTTVDIQFSIVGGAPTTMEVPFEDPAIRDALTGAYLRAGTYEEPA